MLDPKSNTMRAGKRFCGDCTPKGNVILTRIYFPVSSRSLSCTVLLLWWKSRPSTVHFDVELFKPFRSIPADQFALRADEMIPVQLSAEELMLNERFSFARVSLSWLSLGSAVTRSFLQSRHIIYIWPNYVTEKDVLNKKCPL